jgi:hypothetical protein
MPFIPHVIINYYVFMSLLNMPCYYQLLCIHFFIKHAFYPSCYYQLLCIHVFIESTVAPNDAFAVESF